MKCLIIGGGIAGLTTAIALERFGIQVAVYEASPALKPAGAGIWMAVNAMQVLSRLGIADDVLANGASLDRVEIADHKLRTIQRTDMVRYRSEFGYSIVSILRSRLQQILQEHYKGELHLGKKLVSVENDASQVIARFADGTSASGDILIGADGIHSAVRGAMGVSGQLRYSGQTCWRGIAPVSLPVDLSSACVETWGQQIRLGFSVVSPAEVYWFAVANAPEGGRDAKPDLKTTLQERFRDFADPIPEILEATPVSRIIRNDIHDLVPLDSWHSGRICLIGDAAHATTPNMGQGGGQAVEDAWYLAEALITNRDPEVAFREFEAKRRKRVAQIVQISWRIGKMAHVGTGIGFRNALMRMVPEQLVHRQMRQLYALS